MWNDAGLRGKGLSVLQVLWGGTSVMPLGQEATAGGPGVTGPPRASASGTGLGAGPGVLVANNHLRTPAGRTSPMRTTTKQ